MAGNSLVIRGWNGWEFWKEFLPDYWQAKSAAKKMLRSYWKDKDLRDFCAVIETESAAYRVLNHLGELEVIVDYQSPRIRQ